MHLVTGASGTIGSRLVERLRQEGQLPRVAGRSPGRLKERWPDLQSVRLDALRPVAEESFDGIDTVYYLIHSMGEGEEGFAERDQRAARGVADAARKAGVRRIVYLGGLGDPADQLSPHLASRQETGRVLAEYGPPVLELRAGVILGRDSASFRMLWDLVNRLPVMVAPRWVDTRAQPIAIDDVIAYLARAPDVGLGEHHTIVEIGGAEMLSYKGMMERLARLRGKRRRIITVPVLTPRLSSLWCAFVTSVPLAVARPLIDGVRNEVIVRDESARKLFPTVRPMGFDDAVRAAMGAER